MALHSTVNCFQFFFLPGMHGIALDTLFAIRTSTIVKSSLFDECSSHSYMIFSLQGPSQLQAFSLWQWWLSHLLPLMGDKSFEQVIVRCPIRGDHFSFGCWPLSQGIETGSITVDFLGTGSCRRFVSAHGIPNKRFRWFRHREAARDTGSRAAARSLCLFGNFRRTSE